MEYDKFWKFKSALRFKFTNSWLMVGAPIPCKSEQGIDRMEIRYTHTKKKSEINRAEINLWKY